MPHSTDSMISKRCFALRFSVISLCVGVSGLAFALTGLGFTWGLGWDFFLFTLDRILLASVETVFYLNANLPLKGRDLMQTEHFRAKQRFRKGRCLLQ